MREALGFFGKSFGGIWLCPALTSCTPEAPKPKRRGRPPKAKAQALANYKADDPERLPRDRWVTMSNALTRAAHGLTLAEKRIVASAVSKLDSRRVLPPGEVPRTRITAMEYAETFEVDLDTAYDQLQEAATTLQAVNHLLRTRPQAQRQAATAHHGANALGGVGEVPEGGRLGGAGMVAGSAAASDRPQSAVHHLPATASLRAALGLLVETAGAADALSVHGQGRIHD